MAKKRGDNGLFTQIGDEQRKVRSLRLTDTTWDTLGRIAESKKATRADLVEELSATYYMDTIGIEPCNTRAQELPEPAILLNQLKGKYPRSKASLKDIEAILEILGD